METSEWARLGIQRIRRSLWLASRKKWLVCGPLQWAQGGDAFGTSLRLGFEDDVGFCHLQ